jgi:hypothetical protein
MDQAFGVFTELNLSKYLSIGGQILDDTPDNEYFDPVGFFGNTEYNYQAFVRWALPTSGDYYSYHMLTFYTYNASENKTAGDGWYYVGNQGVSKNLILTLKASYGSGRVLKYNGAYAVGFVYLNPLKRPGDQAGAALIANELNNRWEYGLDTYYKFFIAEWVTAGGSLQTYLTQTNEWAFIPGLRVMMTY